MRRFSQSILLLVLCALAAAAVGSWLYFVFAILAATVAIASGVYIVLGVALGLVWPVLVVAYVAYVASRAKQAQALRGATSRSRPTEAELSRVEDAEQREN